MCVFSCSTARRSLRDAVLNSCKTRQKRHLTARHNKECLEFARVRKNWTGQTTIETFNDVRMVDEALNEYWVQTQAWKKRGGVGGIESVEKAWVSLRRLVAD